ncbi:MAG: hypothetical protein ACLRPV_07055 [Lacrimispora saccharolytica]
MRTAKPIRLDAVVLSTQHDPDVTQEQIHEDIKKYVFDPILPAEHGRCRYQVLHQPDRTFRNRRTAR